MQVTVNLPKETVELHHQSGVSTQKIAKLYPDWMSIVITISREEYNLLQNKELSSQ